MGFNVHVRPVFIGRGSAVGVPSPGSYCRRDPIAARRAFMVLLCLALRAAKTVGFECIALNKARAEAQSIAWGIDDWTSGDWRSCCGEGQHVRLERANRSRGTLARRRPDDRRVDGGEAKKQLGCQSEARRCGAGRVEEHHRTDKLPAIGRPACTAATAAGLNPRQQ